MSEHKTRRYFVTAKDETTDRPVFAGYIDGLTIEDAIAKTEEKLAAGDILTARITGATEQPE